MNRPSSYQSLNMIGVFLGFILLSGCADRLKWIDVPTDVFILRNEVVAFQTDLDKGQVLTQEISLKPLRESAGEFDKIALLQYQPGAPTAVPFDRKGDRITADLVGDETYLLVARATGRIQDIYGVLCRLDQQRAFISSAGPGTFDKICTQILCAPTQVRANDIIAGFPELEGMPVDFGDLMVGGLEPGNGSGGICERCTGLNSGKPIFLDDRCTPMTPLPPDEEEQCRSVIFQDDFEADMAGNPPATSPAGAPTDDSLNLQGSPGSIVVIDSVPHGSNAVRINRDGSAMGTVLEAVSGAGLHNSGTFLVSFSAYNSFDGLDAPSMSVTVNSSTGHRALMLVIDDGQYNLISGAGPEILANGYTVNAVDEFKIRTDFNTRTFSIDLNATTVASGKPFLDTGFNDLKTLKFEHTPAILEARPVTMVADKIKICVVGDEFGKQGRVYERLADGSIGSTITGAEIRFVPEAGGAPVTTASDATGSYRQTLPAGRYTVMVSHPAWEDYSSAPGFSVVSGGGLQTANFFLREPRVTSVLIVRHAERPANQDLLTLQGQQRARLLARIAGTAPVSAVYSTDYVRTKATATPLARRLGLELKIYSTSVSLASTILADHEGDTVLVVGHSNTVTKLIEAIGGQDFYASDPDVEDYDNLFLVSRAVSDGIKSVSNLQFGANTTPDTLDLSRDGATTIIALPPAEASGGALTPAGVARANTLPHVLAKAGAAAIYVANTGVTLPTAVPPGTPPGMPVTEFVSSDIAGLISQIETDHAGKTVLVVASRTALRELVEQLSARPVPIILANEHDAFLIIRRLNSGAVVTRLQYGAASP